MSQNSSLNGVIALIEGDPGKARQFFRSPASDIKNVGEATARVYSALDKYVASYLRKILVEALGIQPSSNRVLSEELTEEEDEIFYKGQSALETLIEKHIAQLTPTH
jgi:hypothetical protein